MKTSPQFIYNTRMGSFYHLTPTNLAPLQLDSALLSVGDFVHMKATLEKLANYKITVAKYLNLENQFLCLSSIDGYKMKCVEGVTQVDAVKIYQKEGKKLFRNQDYNALAKLINPHIMISLTEPLEIDPGKKSSNRSIGKSANFLEQSLKELQETQIKIFGALQASLDEEITEAAASKMKFAFDFPNFAGFALYGLPSAQQWSEKDEVIERVFKMFQGLNLEYILPGKGDLVDILWGLNWGINGFEVEVPFSAAQNLKAIILPGLEAEDSELDEYANDSVNFFEFDNKKMKFIQFPIAADVKQHVAIDQKCSCFTCRNHTKLYISHLVECKEMNAQVLLTIHNVHVYQEFQKAVAKLRDKPALSKWTRWFLNKL